jgi:hypothetical protein
MRAVRVGLTDLAAVRVGGEEDLEVSHSVNGFHLHC